MSFTGFAAFSALLKVSLACNGLLFLTKYARNCDGSDQVIKLVNASVDFLENCDVVLSSCAEIKPYQKAQVSVTIMKNNRTVGEKQSIDLCDKKKKLSDMMIITLAFLGVPTYCPITKSALVCVEKKKVSTVSPVLQKVLGVFTIDGLDSVVRINIVHDTGKTCFEYRTHITKKD